MTAMTAQPLQQHSSRKAVRCQALARSGLGSPRHHFCTPHHPNTAGIRAPLAGPVVRKRTVTVSAVDPPTGSSYGGGPPQQPPHGGGRGGSSGGSSGGFNRDDEFWQKMPPPPQGFTWRQIYIAGLGVGLVAAFTVSPIPGWIQDNVFKASKKVEEAPAAGREMASEAAEKVSGKTSAAASHVSGTSSKLASDVKEGATYAADTGRSKATSAVDTVKSTAKEGVEKVKSTAKEGVERAKSTAQEGVERVEAGTEAAKGKTGDIFASVGRALHIVPEEGKKAKGAAEVTVKRMAERGAEIEREEEEASKEWYKRWQTYAAGGIALGLIGAAAYVAHENLGKDKGGKKPGVGGDKVKGPAKVSGPSTPETKAKGGKESKESKPPAASPSPHETAAPPLIST